LILLLGIAKYEVSIVQSDRVNSQLNFDSLALWLLNTSLLSSPSGISLLDFMRGTLKIFYDLLTFINFIDAFF